MTQNPTPDPERDLSASQLKALGALLSGEAITRAAEAAGVDRSTVHRWLREDWSFQAALNRGRRELRDAVLSCLLRSAEQAAGVVARAVDEGDLKVALAVLKGLGLLSGGIVEIETDDPGALRDHAELAAREEERERELRRMLAF